ncbi:hypothetical protein ACH5RR_030242 [Cinchona calisaya]|uniref:Uncharacterized protein n=1 Tax=Cinchona calisaya TaxID=153742 RepID=A0ABD2YVF0_9GENT
MAHHVDDFLSQLESLESFRDQIVSVKEKIHHLKLELRFLKTFFNFTGQLFLKDGYLKFSSERVRDVVAIAASDIQQASVKSLGQRAIYHLVSEASTKITAVRRNVRAVYRVALRLQWPNAFTSNEPVLKSFDSVLQNLQDLLNFKAGCNDILKKQIEALDEKFRFLKTFLWFREHGSMEKELLKDLSTRVKTVGDTAACHSYFCWVDKMDENTMGSMNCKLAGLLDMINPLTREIEEIGFRYWKASTSLGSQTAMPVQAVEQFVDFLLENLTASMKDQKKRLYEGLAYLIKYLIDPPQEFRNDEELRLTHTKAVARQAGYLIYSFHVEEIRDEMFKDKESVLPKLIEKVKIITAEACLVKLLRHELGLKQWGILLEGLIFLRKSLIDPTKEYLGDWLADISEMAKDAEILISSFNTDSLKKDEVVEANLPLLVLLQKIKLVKVQVLLMQLLNQKHPMKDQLVTLHESLKFLITFLKEPPMEYLEDEKWILTQIDIVTAEVEAFIKKFPVQELTESMISKLNHAHYQLLEMIKLVKAEAYLMQQVGHKDSPVKDEMQTFHLGLRILRTFHRSQQEEHNMDRENILAQTEAVFTGAATLVCSLCESKEEEDIEMEINNLLLKINVVTKEIGRAYDHFSLSSWSNCPRTDGLGFIDRLIRNLQDLLNYKTHSISSVECQIEIIHLHFKFVRKSLDEYSDLHYEHDGGKNLQESVIQLAYEAEYIINSFLVQDYPVWFHLLQFFDIIEKVKLIRRKVEKLVDEKRRGGAKVRNVSLQADNAQSDENTVYPEEETKSNGKSTVVGFNHQADEIREKLIHGSKQLGIVSIVGMAGQGKTTLATKVYDDSNVCLYFNIRAWCYVSERYQKKKMLLNILRNMSANKDNEKSGEDLAEELGQIDSDFGDDDKSEEDLAHELRKRLLRRTYLIVMDDVWNIEAWDLLRECFPENQNNGSRILVTSRYANLFNEDESNCFTHHLRRLEDEESWELLKKEVFDGEKPPTKLLRVGRKIAKSCEGLPLAVTLIAGFLRTKEQTEGCWNDVARSLASTYADKSVLGKYKRILEHSYKDLSFYLKPCFLYLGTFLEGTEIPVYKLIWLWIAEGFVCKNKSESSEKVAEGYLMDLIRRNLIKSTEERSKGGVKACSVHDILREFCRAKAKEENFFQLISECRRSSTSDGLDFLYRLCIDSKQEHFIASQDKPSDPRLCSLLFSAARQIHSLGGDEVFFISQSFKLLRVLDLGSFTIRGFPSGIEDLVLLRFLSLWMDSSLIPPSIAKLHDLETFLLRQSRGEVELPDSFWSMVSLRHVHIRNRASLGHQDNGRHDFGDREKDHEKASSKNTKLDNLQSFSTPCLFYGEHMKKRMMKLPNLLKLRCTFMDTWDPVKNCILFPELSFLTELESLKVSYHGSVKDLSDQLNLSNLGQIFPVNLKKLTLTKFRMPWKYISEIGKLKNLEVLKLLFKAFDGQQWKMEEGEFLKLKFLKLESLNIVEWSASEDNVSNLEQLVLKDCKQLQKIPSCLETAENLKLIEVQGCTSAVSQSVEEIKEAQLQDNNEIKLNIDNPVRH